MAVDPRVRALFDLAAGEAEGEVELGGHRIALERGQVVDVLPGDAGAATGSEGPGGRDAWVARLRVALARAAAEDRPPSKLEPSAPAMFRRDGAPLVPLVLDALAEDDASTLAEVHARLNHRLSWNEGPHLEAARTWASLGDALRPAVSTLLAKQRDAGPRIGALLRAGLVVLSAPGQRVSSIPVKAGSLPPPPARRSIAPTDAPRGDPFEAVAPMRRGQVRLDPGSARPDDEPLAPTPLRAFAPSGDTFDDPLWSVECEIAWLEQVGAPGSERARALRTLAGLWRDRLGSAGEAAHAACEAVAADPSDAELVHEAAALCHAAGDAPLALRYAEAAVDLADTGEGRAAARRTRARLHAALGRLDACIEDLCEASADDPSAADAHEAVADLLLAHGDRTGANAHLRLAAAALGESAAERASALLRWALDLAPSDPATAFELSSALDAAGHRIAALQTLARAADHARDPARRRGLRLAVARGAAALGRSDLELDALEAALDDDPADDATYGPLEEALQRARSPVLQAAVLEDLAAACPPHARGPRLARAAAALVDVPGGRETAFWLAYEATLSDPRAPEPLALLRAHARSPREATVLAHALRAAIAVRIGSDDRAAVELLEELARVAEERIANPHLARAAWAQVAKIEGGDARVRGALDRLDVRLAEARAHEERCEKALYSASPSQEGQASFEYARALPNLPEHWPRATELYQRALDRGVEVVATTAALELLLGLGRDPEALATFLEGRLEAKPSRAERLRLLERLAAVHVARQDARAVAVRCAELTALAGGSPLAEARWRRAARKLRDPELEPPASSAGLPPTTADDGVPRRPRTAPPASGQSAMDGRRTTLVAWCALVPSDTDSACALVALEQTGEDAAAIHRASMDLLRGLPTRTRLSAAGSAVDRLLALGAADFALDLLATIGSLLGRPGDGLTGRVLELARAASGEQALRALEWAAASREPDTRIGALREIVRLHRARADRLAESRALARLFVERPDDEEARDRLASLLADMGDPSRLVACLQRALEVTGAAEARERVLLDLVSASLRLEDGRARAEAYVRKLVAERVDDLDAVRRALGVLFSVGDTDWALASCNAIAEGAPSAIGGRIALWSVLTLERATHGPEAALDAAMRAAVRYPLESSLLLTVERLALERGSIDRATQTYERLIEASMGAHGRRALRYRAGRWLERAGRPTEALAHYLAAFELSPGLGVAYRAAERVAGATANHASLVDLHVRLKDVLRDPALKSSFLQRAAQTCFEHTGELLRGYELLVEANALSETFELDDELQRRAQALLARGEGVAREVAGLLRRHWEERLEGLWDASARIACLHRLSDLLADAFADVSGAIARLDEASALVSQESLDSSVEVEIARKRDELRGRVGGSRDPGAPPPPDA